MCRELRRRNLGVTLTAMGVNPLGATEELFAEMESAGFNSVSGVVTGKPLDATLALNTRACYPVPTAELKCARQAKEALTGLLLHQLQSKSDDRREVEAHVDENCRPQPFAVECEPGAHCAYNEQQRKLKWLKMNRGEPKSADADG